MIKNIEDFVIECLESDFDINLLFSIKNVDICKIVNKAVHNYEYLSLNTLIELALKDYAYSVLNKNKSKILYKDIDDFYSNYVRTYVNGLDTHLYLSEDVYEDLDVQEIILENLDNDLRDFK